MTQKVLIAGATGMLGSRIAYYLLEQPETELRLLVRPGSLALSRETVMKLANSLPQEEALRQAYLSAPVVRRILGDNVAQSRLAC